MKKYLLIALCFMCASCADLDAQMSSFKKSLSGDGNQNTQNNATVVAPTDSSVSNSQAKKVNNQSATNSVSVNKQSSTPQTSIQASNNNRASQPDWVSKMKQDMEDAKSPKQKEMEEGRRQYKDLLSQANSAYRCSGLMFAMPVTIVVLRDGVVFMDMSDKVVSNLYSEIKINDNLVYFSQNDTKTPSIKLKYVLDTSNNKLVQLVDSAGAKNANESTCKKIK